MLDVLRDAPGPLGSMALARAAMERKGMVAADAGALRRRKGQRVERQHRAVELEEDDLLVIVAALWSKRTQRRLPANPLIAS